MTPAFSEIELECASRKRRALLYVPISGSESKVDKRLDTAKPLLIAFHGGSGQPDQMERLTGLASIAEKEDFFVCYPEGINRGWNDGRNIPRRRDIDDAKFIEQLVEHLCESFPIDRQRVYACGISNGGFFAQYLAARAPGLLAAVASIAATVHEPMFKDLVPGESIPILFVVGKDDPVIPFGGGEIELASRKAGHVVPADDGFKYWASTNHAALNSDEEWLAPLHPDDEEDRTRVLKRVFAAGENGCPVEAFIVEGGGHAWPSGWQYYRERYIGKTSQQLDASRVVVDFMMRFSRKSNYVSR